MAKEEKFAFSHKEIVEELIKRQDIHEGIWRLYIEFAFGAGNAGPSPEQIVPTALIGIQRIGILRVEAEDALSVDAARVNPKPAEPESEPRRRRITM